MKCPHCGLENVDNVKKCTSCNKKLMLGGRGRGALLVILSLLALSILLIFVYIRWDNNNEDDDQGDLDNNNQTIVSEDGLFAATGEGSDIHGALHRIEYGEHVVYLFGTMHAAAPAWFPLADVVEDAMRRADVFAFEVDMDFGNLEFEEMMALVEIASDMHLTNQTLADVIPQAVYESLVRYIETYDMTYEEVYRMNPVALAMTLEVAVVGDVLAEFGIYYDEQMGVDGYILDFANRNHRPVLGLEPLTQQMRIGFAPNQEILDDVGFNGTLEAIFYDALKDFVPRDALFARFYEGTTSHDEYLSNDIEGIIAGMVVTSEEMENAFMRYMVEVLMNFRSTYYANRIAELLHETEEPTTFFVAVGLSHVIREGEYLTNIVEQLELLGISADPIWNAQ